jgi:hypothetical protein
LPSSQAALDGCKPPGEHVAQCVLERERRAVLDHDVVEPSNRRMAFGRKCLDAQLLDEPDEHFGA